MASQDLHQRPSADAQERSPLTPLPAAQWFPISTAPRDGTAVLLIGRYPNNRGWSDIYQSWLQADWADHWARWPHSFAPTHWMPLPAPPSDQSAGNVGDAAGTPAKSLGPPKTSKSRGLGLP